MFLRFLSIAKRKKKKKKKIFLGGMKRKNVTPMIRCYISSISFGISSIAKEEEEEEKRFLFVFGPMKRKKDTRQK